MKWADLLKIYNSSFIRSMYMWLFIVPISVKLFQHIEDVVSVTVFEYSFEIQTSLPFSWQIFYFSALFFVLGNVVLIFRCPELVKDHSDFQGFLSQGKDVRHLSEYALKLGVDEKMFGKQLQSVTQDSGGVTEKDSRYLFWYLFDIAKKYNFHWLLACRISYIIGFSLVAIVLIQNLVQVIGYLS